MARDAQRAETQGKKRDTTIFGGRDTTVFGGGGGTAMGDPTKREEFDEKNRQFDQSLDLEGAKAGLTQGGDRGPAGAALPAYEESVAAQSRAGVDPRFAELQKEMQRGQEQMGQDLEVTRQGKGWRADPGTAAGQKEKRAGYEAKTDRISAVANYQRAVNALNIAQIKARGAKTTDARKGFLEAADKVKTSLILPLRSSSGALNRLMARKGTKSDWGMIRKALQNVSNDGRLAEMKQGADQQMWNDALQSMMEAKISVQALKYIAATGEIPAQRLGEQEPVVDPSSEGMQKFFLHTVEAKAQLAIQGVVFQDPGDPQAKKAFDPEQFTRNVIRINKLAAWQTLNKKPIGGGAGGLTEAQGQMPNPATPGRKEALQPDYEDRQGRDAQGQPVTEPVRTITEKGAKRKAAEPVPFQKPEARERKQEDRSPGGIAPDPFGRW